MKQEDRRHEIVELLIDEGTVSLDELVTIEASGQFESDVRYRSRIAAEEKRRIARAGAAFVGPGTSIMIDDGSTSQSLAPILIERTPLTVITNYLALIVGLTGVAGIELIALGGTYAKKFNGFFGVLTEKALSGLRADVALLSSSAIEGRTAFHQDQEVLEVKRRMIASSARRYLMANHRKFGRTALHLLSDLAAFDEVVTTQALDVAAADALRRDGIALEFMEDKQ